MNEKQIITSVSDKLGIIEALIKTANLAIGNMEYFGRDGQDVAITLDIASDKLEECRKLLDSLGKDKEGSR